MFDSRSLYFIVVLFSMCYLSAPQANTFEAATEQVKATLVASVDAVHPGDEILVGVNQLIIPHWHTYWKNPGDSGLATTIDYTLPSGATAGEIQWPTPTRIAMGPVINFGYSNEVTLLSSIKIPGDSVVGSVFPIKAKVKWLVCEESCIPQQVDLALDLAVVSTDVNTGHGSPLIEKARARIPVVSPWMLSLEHQNENALSLRINGGALSFKSVHSIWFYPDEWGRVVHSAEQPWHKSGVSIEVKLKSGEAPLSVGQSLSGILEITEDSNGEPITRGYIVNVAAKTSVTSVSGAGESDVVLTSALLLAFLGGVILNLMPCVFPVLSIKALALIKHAHQAPKQTRLHGLAYTLGILVSFALLAGVLIALKAGGVQVGWGFQFQSPLFVLAVAYLMFTVGLSLSGVFSIGGSIAGVGSSLVERSGYSGSFFTGVLATVVATPCTAPFMGVAIGFALTQPPFVLLSVFFSLGFGLALPYLLLSLFPGLQRRLPKPGVWMDRLKQGLAFPMYGTAVWLVWVLAQQAGANAVATALGGMVIIAFAAWLYEFTKYSSNLAKRSGISIAGLSLFLVFAGGYLSIESPANALTVQSSNNFEAYSAERLSALRKEGKPVFVNLTAAWCISCLVNEKVALSQTSVIDAFKRASITYLKGDWTNRDAEITRLLAEFGRSGVPLYVFYPAGNGKPIVLPQILTPEIVTNTVTESVLVGSAE